MKRRTRKGVALPPQIEHVEPSASLGSPVVEFRAADGTVETLLDFGKYPRPVMAREFAHIARRRWARYAPESRKIRFYTLEHWFRFLDEVGCPTERLANVTTGVVLNFIEWLKRQPSLGYNSQGTRYGTVRSILLEAKSVFRPVLDELDPPRYAFLRHKASPPRESIPLDVYKALRRAARAEIEQAVATVETGKALIREREGDERPLNPNEDLASALVFVQKRFGGVVPEAKALCAAGCSRFDGSIEPLSRHLHATVDTLIPFVIRLGMELFANPQGVIGLTRDCIIPHLFEPGKVIVWWRKGRAGQIQYRICRRTGRHSVPALIDQVLDLTAPLVEQAVPRHRSRLLLARFLRGDRAGVGPVRPLDNYTDALNRFCDRHPGLRGPDGKPLFTLAQLRPTGLRLAHERASGRDIRKTRVLANHRGLQTTKHYLDDPATRAEHAVQISKLQVRFVGAVRSGRLGPWDIAGGPRPEPDDMTEPLDGAYETASGYRCSNPFEGIAPGSKPGEFCPNAEGCDTCPNHRMPKDVEHLARQLQRRDHMLEARPQMHPRRWEKLYGWRVRLIDEHIVPEFTDDDVAAAHERAQSLPPLPEIATR